jgi:hypothetical protein
LISSISEVIERAPTDAEDVPDIEDTPNAGVTTTGDALGDATGDAAEGTIEGVHDEASEGATVRDCANVPEIRVSGRAVAGTFASYANVTSSRPNGRAAADASFDVTSIASSPNSFRATSKAAGTLLAK